MHIFHIGYGLDATASAITLLAHLGHFGSERGLDNRLSAAYIRFDQWCKLNGRTTSIDEFTKLSFGMGPTLSFSNGQTASFIVIPPEPYA